jgi:transcriptional regulator with XRE-family HTH domain
MSDQLGISLASDDVHLSVRTPSVGARVRAARTKDVRMTLNQFAAAVGVSTCSLSVLENGARPSKETVEKIAAFLGRPVHELDPEAWAFDRQAPRRVNAVPRSAQHASVGARAFDTSR